MNIETDNLHGVPQPDLAIEQPPAEPGRRKGKVARLPRAVREELNEMMLDGVAYLEIIGRLGPAGVGLNEVNLTAWKEGGYQDWLRERQLVQALQAKHELALAIVAHSGDDNAAGAAVLQVIARNLCEFLADTDPATIRESLLSDSDKFTRFVKAMVRLAEGGIKCELHKCRAQDRATQMAKQKQPAERPGVSTESLRKAEEMLRLR